jgi:hypothetical protein
MALPSLLRSKREGGRAEQRPGESKRLTGKRTMGRTCIHNTDRGLIPSEKFNNTITLFNILYILASYYYH